MKTFNIPQGTCLYRYDLNEPPENWSIDYYNPEYIYGEIKKNMFHGNFFFNSEMMARKTAHLSIQKQNYIYKGAWITKSLLTQDLKLLDFRYYNFITKEVFVLN